MNSTVFQSLRGYSVSCVCWYTSHVSATLRSICHSYWRQSPSRSALRSVRNSDFDVPESRVATKDRRESFLHCRIIRIIAYIHNYKQQESPADAVKPARRKSMPKLLQFDVFRFISPNSISPNCQCIASHGRPIFSQALGLYSCTQFEIRCLPIIKFLVQIAST